MHEIAIRAPLSPLSPLSPPLILGAIYSIELE